jgi:hypothetical protein
MDEGRAITFLLIVALVLATILAISLGIGRLRAPVVGVEAGEGLVCADPQAAARVEIVDRPDVVTTAGTTPARLVAAYADAAFLRPPASDELAAIDRATQDLPPGRWVVRLGTDGPVPLAAGMSEVLVAFERPAVGGDHIAGTLRCFAPAS